jgi:hypothetical protein
MINYLYIAGFFDGEGSVRVRMMKSSKAGDFGYFLVPHLDISQKYPEILYLIRDILGIGYVTKQLYGWVLIINRRDHCLRFIDIFEPLVIIKKEQLRLLRSFLSLKKDHGIYSKSMFLESLNIVESIARLNSKHSERTIERVQKIRAQVINLEYSPEIRGKRISQKLQGRVFSSQSREKMSIAASQRVARSKRDRLGRFE